MKALLSALVIALVSNLAFAGAKVMNPGEAIGQLVFLSEDDVKGGTPKMKSLNALSIAVFAELSTLTLILEPAVFLLPLARFPAFIWILCIAAALPAQRSRIGGADSRTTS